MVVRSLTPQQDLSTSSSRVATRNALAVALSTIPSRSIIFAKAPCSCMILARAPGSIAAEEYEEEGFVMKVDKFKRQATLRVSTGGRLDVNFFLSYSTDEHPGRELIIDVLNSERSFIPLEDILKDEILMIGKNRFMDVELTDRDLLPETLEAREIEVQIELINGDLVEGSFYTDLPPDKLRLSDYLNFTPQFIYLCRDRNDVILNKDYILSLTHR